MDTPRFKIIDPHHFTNVTVTNMRLSREPMEASAVRVTNAGAGEGGNPLVAVEVRKGRAIAHVRADAATARAIALAILAELGDDVPGALDALRNLVAIARGTKHHGGTNVDGKWMGVADWEDIEAAERALAKVGGAA